MTQHITQEQAAKLLDADFKRFLTWAGTLGYDTAHTYDTDRSKWLALSPMTADLWKAWQAAEGSAALAQPASEPDMGNPISQSAPAAVSGWPCEIISGDFVENTLTIEMKCDDYRISAGRFYLTAAPTGEPG